MPLSDEIKKQADAAVRGVPGLTAKSKTSDLPHVVKGKGDDRITFYPVGLDKLLSHLFEQYDDVVIMDDHQRSTLEKIGETFPALKAKGVGAVGIERSKDHQGIIDRKIREAKPEKRHEGQRSTVSFEQTPMDALYLPSKDNELPLFGYDISTTAVKTAADLLGKGNSQQQAQARENYIRERERDYIRERGGTATEKGLENVRLQAEEDAQKLANRLISKRIGDNESIADNIQAYRQEHPGVKKTLIIIGNAHGPDLEDKLQATGRRAALVQMNSGARVPQTLVTDGNHDVDTMRRRYGLPDYHVLIPDTLIDGYLPRPSAQDLSRINAHYDIMYQAPDYDLGSPEFVKYQHVRGEAHLNGILNILTGIQSGEQRSLKASDSSLATAAQEIQEFEKNIMPLRPEDRAILNDAATKAKEAKAALMESPPRTKDAASLLLSASERIKNEFLGGEKKLNEIMYENRKKGNALGQIMQGISHELMESSRSLEGANVHRERALKEIKAAAADNDKLPPPLPRRGRGH